MKQKGLSILVLVITAAMCALVASALAPPTPFMIQGYVFYGNGNECKNPIVNINNTNTGYNWSATTNASYNYYQLILANGTDINASEILRFNVTSPNGNQSNITVHTVMQENINNGGIFNFNISLAAAPTAIIFDTGQGTYPSIMGVHEGNFTPKCDITVHQIYTYPCAGTGGHSERVIFYDYETGETKIDVNWTGYQGDYHNLTVSPPVKLLEGKEYRYEITTGSYPQIIHNETCANAFGTMTCTKFTDANGKNYDNWIPAIRLE